MSAGKPQNAKTKELDNARALLEEGRLDASIRSLRSFWLMNPTSVEAVDLLANIMESANREEAAKALSRLKTALEGATADENNRLEKHPEASFEAGYHLIDTREYELAVMLLRTCLLSAPTDSTLNYELGFALMSLSKYEEAIERFIAAGKTQDDFDTTLNLSVCYALLRKLKEAKELVKKLKSQAKSEEEKHEIHHREIVLKRLERLSRKAQLSERDWLFALYGTMIIHDSPSSAGKTGSQASTRGTTAGGGMGTAGGSTETADGGTGSAGGSTRTAGGIMGGANAISKGSLPVAERLVRKETFRTIAATMLTLKGVLEGLRLIPEAIEFYSTQSRPLAAILARLLDLPLDSYRGPDRPDHALLVMKWASDVTGPHEVFIGHAANRSIFAYGLTRQDPLPLVPDMIAHFTDQLILPWSDDPELEDDDTACAPEEAIPQVLERAWNMEHDPDILKAVQDAIEYYRDKKELLVMGNVAQFPLRPEYSAEVPI